MLYFSLGLLIDLWNAKKKKAEDTAVMISHHYLDVITITTFYTVFLCVFRLFSGKWITLETEV